MKSINASRTPDPTNTKWIIIIHFISWSDLLEGIGSDLIFTYRYNEEINTNLYNSGILNTYSYHINPLKFLFGLANQLLKLKVKIYENTPITKILNDKEGVKLFTNSKVIKTNKVIVGCNGYLDKLLGNIRNKFIGHKVKLVGLI